MAQLFIAGSRSAIRNSVRAAVWLGSLHGCQTLRTATATIFPIAMLSLGLSTNAHAAAVNLRGTLDAQRLQQQMMPPSAPPKMGENYIPELREAEPDTPPPVQDG